MIRISGRVMTVQVTDAGFRVTVGPPPDVFLFTVVGKPPKIGEKVTVDGDEKNRDQLNAESSMTEIVCYRFTVDHSISPMRIVPPYIVERVRRAMRRPLYRYQVEGAGWLCTRLGEGKGAILGDDPGLGKSAQTVAAVTALRAYPVVIVCPSSLKHHWAREFGEATEPPTVYVIAGLKQPIPHGAQVYVLNYETLLAREAELSALAPTLYVFDEAQEVKAPIVHPRHRAASATRLVRQKMRGAVLLTGTPIMNRPAELWRLLHLSEPNKWPRYADYASRYLQPIRGKEVGRSVRTAAGRVERLDELQAEVGPAMLRRLKGDVLADLPPKSRRSVLVHLDDASMDNYRAAAKDVIAWLKSIGRQDRVEKAMAAQSIVQLNLLRRIAAIGKMRQAVPEYLKAWFGAGAPAPLVIFGYHQDVMLSLWKLCRSMGLRVAGIGGGEPVAKRQAQVDAFQAGQAHVFLAPIKCAGVGLNLQRASDALFIERVWTPSGMIQAEDRLHRIGTKNPVTITYLDAKGTVDERIAKVLEDKQRLIRAVVDDNDQNAESLSTVLKVIDELVQDEV